MAMGAVLSSNLRAEDLHEDAFEDELYLGGHGIVRRGDRWILMNGLTYPAPPILRGSGIDLETGDIHVGDIQMNNEDPLLDAFLGKVWRDGKLEGRQMIAANRLSTGGYIERFFKNPLRELELERFFVDNTELPKSDFKASAERLRGWFREYQAAIESSQIGKPILEEDFKMKTRGTMFGYCPHVYGDRINELLNDHY